MLETKIGYFHTGSYIVHVWDMVEYLFLYMVDLKSQDL
jgi:hypothetical protein